MEIDDSDTSEKYSWFRRNFNDNQTDLDKMDASDTSEDDSNMTSMIIKLN